MKGMFFPSNYTDKQSGLNILAPPNAFIKWVPKECGTKEREAYRDWYDKKYGKKLGQNLRFIINYLGSMAEVIRQAI